MVIDKVSNQLDDAKDLLEMAESEYDKAGRQVKVTMTSAMPDSYPYVIRNQYDADNHLIGFQKGSVDLSSRFLKQIN